MARKRFHNARRSRASVGSERSYLEYMLSAPAPVMTRAEIVRLLRGGEDTYLELKVRFSNVEKLTAEIIALANTAGGAIIFGVNDQLRIEGVDDPESIETQLREICSRLIQPPVFPYINKVAFDNGRRIVLLEVDAQDRPHRTMDDRFYVREGSTKREATREELSRIYDESNLTRFEQVPVFQSWVEDIDESLFWSYVRGVNPGYWGDAVKGFPTELVMRDMGLVSRFGEEWVPNFGGILLFGHHEKVAAIAPGATLAMTRYSGRDISAPIVEQVKIEGNLLRLFEGAINFVARYADLWDARPSRKTLGAAELPIEGRANYHRGVIVEVMTNALVHRDWSAYQRPARLNVFDESIEVINPTKTIDQPVISLRYGVANPPNPRIKAIFTNHHYGINVSRGGIPMIFEEGASFARRAPEGPAIANGDFRLKVYGLT